MILFLWIFTLLASCYKTCGMPASPNGFHVTQPNGAKTPLLFIRGDDTWHWIEDSDGYTVLIETHETHIDGTNTYIVVYAELDEISGELKPTTLVVGRADPIANGLTKHLQPTDRVKRKICGEFCDEEENSYQTLVAENSFIPSNRVKNLVIPVIFKDHQERRQPSKSDLDVLFNKQGGDPVLAPTGSIKDYCTENSYGNFMFESVVYDWITLPDTEKYYADGKSGLGSKFWEAIVFALSIVDNDPNLSLADFDENGDGLIDSLTFVHSGYSAEIGGFDCYDTSMNDRIWDHQWTMKTAYISNDGVQANKYVVASGLWGLCGSEIAHLATFAHMSGHVLGLPDLNDGQKGYGIGSFGLMGNSWGFDGTQHSPPTMDPWCKIQLGWANVVDITSNGIYELEASALNSTIYRIQKKFPPREYLLIENKQPIGFDSYLPHGGLAIWHIDDTMKQFDKVGYPGQFRYPRNNKHYRISLLQRDGAYDLEHGRNNGDDGDLWFGNNYELGPSRVKCHGPFPNTDSYSGRIKKTKIRIFNISESASKMTFEVSFPNTELDQTQGSPLLEFGRTKYNIRGATIN